MRPLLAAALVLAAACSDAGPIPADYSHIDAELLAPEDPHAVPENPEWTDWVRRNATPIRSLTSTDYADLQFLKPLLEGKTIVQLGESGHGVGEFDAMKVRLVKFLHDEMDFDVIAFEAGMYECWVADSLAQVALAVTTMKNCAYQIWWANETLPLFEYIQNQKALSSPLTLAGFDVQPRLNELTLGYRKLFSKLLSPIDTVYARQVDDFEALWLANKLLRGTGSPPDSVALVLAHYRRIDSVLKANLATLQTAHGSQAFVLALMIANSRQAYVRQITRIPLADRLAARDTGMAENIAMLRAMYPGKRIIVWAHNAHVRHANHLVVPSPTASMGSWLADRYRDELYTVGLYMYSGSAADNTRKTYNVIRSFASSLESVTYHSRLKFAFFDFSQAPNIPGTSWMRVPLFAMDWGTQVKSLVLRDQYDGVIVVNKTNPPTYIP